MVWVEVRFAVASRVNLIWVVPGKNGWIVNHQRFSEPRLLSLGTFCNCQWTVFSLGVSQHMHKITNLWKFELNSHRSCEIIIGEMSHKVVCFQLLDFGASKSNSEVSNPNSNNISVKNYFFLEKYVTSEEAHNVSHKVLYYQQLSYACYQVRFYANNIFEYLPIVSSASKAPSL